MAALWTKIAGSLSAKLLVLLVSSMAIVFGLLGYPMLSCIGGIWNALHWQRQRA